MLSQFKYILIPVFIAFVFVSKAQQDTSLTREVEVTKAFKPTISDANKLNEMPKADDTKPENPKFDYKIYSSPVLNTFSVKPLKAARITRAQKKETGYGLIKAGVGNYNKPYAEFFFNNVNSKNSIFGIHARHLSSFGKVTLDGGDKVDAPYANNDAEVYYLHNLGKSVLGVTVDFKHNGFKYYGYPISPIPDVLKDENQTFTMQGKKQSFSRGGFNVTLKNQTTGINAPVFNFNADYHYFGTKTNQKEHLAKADVDFLKPVNSGAVDIDGGFEFVQSDGIYNYTLGKTGQRQQIWLFFKPAWKYEGKNTSFTAGVNAWFVMDNDVDVVAKIAPNIKFGYTPVKDVIKLYAGIDGNYINNNYSKIAYENPFVNPAHDVKNSFEKLHFYGGIDGKFSAKTNFKISADYSFIDDRQFYVMGKEFADTVAMPGQLVVNNTFDVVYDDIGMLKINMEIFHSTSEKLNLLLSGNYYVYNLDKQPEAWNMPSWDATFSADYKVNERLSVGTDFYLTGERKTLLAESANMSHNIANYSVLPAGYEIHTLKTIFDINFNGTYRFTPKFSAFAQINNAGFQKYQQWFGYTVQSFNVLAGISYAF